MAFALTRLVDAAGQPITPVESDLAFYNAATELAPYAGVTVAKHVEYWKRQKRLAADTGEAAREQVANQLLSWMTVDDKLETVIAQAAATGDAEIVETYSRYIIGGLAMSLALRRGLAGDLNKPLIDAQGTVANPDTAIIDVNYHRDELERPYEPRMHYHREGDLPTPMPDLEPAWYRLGSNLLVQAYAPAIITPPQAAFMQEHGAGIVDPAQYVTYAPHIIAANSPLPQR